MAKRVWHWLEVGFGLLALTLLTLACHAMWPDKDGVAAWFQAIGSVAAIGIAIYVPWKQRANDQAERRKEVMQQKIFLARRAKAVADDLLLACIDLKMRVDNHNLGSRFSYNTENFRLVIEAAKGLENVDHNLAVTELCVELRTLAERIRRGMDEALGQTSISNPFLEQCTQWKGDANAYAYSSSGVLQRAMDASSAH
ncbi:hypothetical protein [Cupriavidus necator]